MKTKVTLRHKEKNYTFIYDWGKYTEDAADFMFTDGNYACDCNKSIFIKQYCDKNFLKMKCGDEIALIELIHNVGEK